MTLSRHPDAPARPLPPLSLVLPEGLPDPGPEARAHAGRLLALIGEEIERGGGAIPFSRYLELALYAPGLGYYSGPLPKLGGPGDFVTAPEISPLFGRCLARQAAEVGNVARARMFVEQAHDGEEQGDDERRAEDIYRKVMAVLPKLLDLNLA